VKWEGMAGVVWVGLGFNKSELSVNMIILPKINWTISRKAEPALWCRRLS